MHALSYYIQMCEEMFFSMMCLIISVWRSYNPKQFSKVMAVSGLNNKVVVSDLLQFT